MIFTEHHFLKQLTCVCTHAGLCLRVKLERCLPYKFKLDIFVTKGMHFTEGDGECHSTLAIVHVILSMLSLHELLILSIYDLLSNNGALCECTLLQVCEQIRETQLY